MSMETSNPNPERYSGTLTQCLNFACPMKQTCFRHTMHPEDAWTHPSKNYYPAVRDNQRYYIDGEAVYKNTGECAWFVPVKTKEE